MRLAVEHIRRMKGGTQAHLMRCDDNGYYIVKFQNNPQHSRVLANEMLATRLAMRLGLNVPPVEVIEVRPEMIAYSADLVMQLGHGRTPCVPGKQLGSQFPGHPSRLRVYDFLPDDQLGAVQNLADFLGVLVFDKWTCNTDGRQAVFVRQSKTNGDGTTAMAFQAVMIDQGFCFNGARWNFPDAPLFGLYRNPFVYRNVTGIDSFKPWLDRIENSFTLTALDEEAQKVPPEWYGEDYGGWGGVIEHLYVRRTRVRELIWSARNAVPDAFPNWTKQACGKSANTARERLQSRCSPEVGRKPRRAKIPESAPSKTYSTYQP